MKISAQVEVLFGDDVKVECENQVKEQPTRKWGWRSGRNRYRAKVKIAEVKLAGKITSAGLMCPDCEIEEHRYTQI